MYKSLWFTSLFIVAATTLPAEVFNATSPAIDPLLEQHFAVPPAGARPWVFWMWLRVDTTFAAITKDLEEMHAKGIEGAILYESGGTKLAWNLNTMVLGDKEYLSVHTQNFREGYSTPLPTKDLAPWSERVQELFRFASKEAGRLGVKLVLSVGLASTSGPIDPEYGQQKLVWSEVTVNGPQDYDAVLSEPLENIPAVMAPLKKIAANPPTGNPFKTREVAVLAVPDKVSFAVSEVVNLSARVDAAGHLRWQVPVGQWKILHFGYRPTGIKNVWGYFTDGMSAEALDKTWEATIGPMLKRMTPEERRGLIGVEDDSWEAGETTWTKLFPEKFQQLRHYDLIPWLPVLAGKNVGSPAMAESVRQDFYRTIADLIATEHYGHLRELANRSGLAAFSEAAGPNSQQLDYLQNCQGVDMAMGEFWMPSPHRSTPARRFLLRNAANANHVSGKRITACESFTSVGPHWEDTFFGMKNTADQAFCDGCNLTVIHCFSQSPSVTARPGYVYFAGTHYTRQNTWWEQTPAFNAYLGRCCHLLQQGLFVAEALYLRGNARGYGEPMKTRPALPAEGYDHDNCTEATLFKLIVNDGRLVLPDGMSYRILVLPEKALMTLEALEQIARLIKAGATVVGPQPIGMAGLALSRDQNLNFKKLVGQLWQETNSIPEVKFGAGQLIPDRSAAEVLSAMNILPDFEFKGLSAHGELDRIHRQAGETDIYFVASRWDPKEKIECTFRVTGKQPELWNPVTGEIRDAVAFRQENGRTIVPLEFDPRESVFVIFRKPIAAKSGSAVSNYPKITPLAELSGAWEVFFDPKWGGPGQVNFDSLIDWTKRSESGIKYYSGTAVYRKTFTLAAPGEKLLLDLGEVHEVASVRLNGVDLGVVWIRPARVDITRAARVGENKLEVTVVNLWPNRMIADESLPKEKRFTESNIHKFTAVTPLYPSGLLGPVTVETAD